MILLTVGVQHPFERLVSAVDLWASGKESLEIFGQIGRSRYIPRHFKAIDYCSTSEMNRLFSEADLIVGHAGVGTILGALEHCKPVIVLPRLHSLYETTTDHQSATASKFQGIQGVHVAEDIGQLHELLDHQDDLSLPKMWDAARGDSMISAVRDWLNRNV